MKRFAGLLVAAAMALPPAAWAQMQPHRAEYSLRLGTALNAPRIGTAVQDIALDCSGWRIKRDVAVDVAFTPSFKIGVASRMEGEEEHGGNRFDYRAVQRQNGVERETSGKVRRRDGAIHVELVTPDGPERSVLPSFTLMPVAMVSSLIRRLKTGTLPDPLLMFGAEATAAAFQIHSRELGSEGLQARPPALKRVDVPAERSWPIFLTVTRAGQPDANPVLSLRARVFDSGVLDQLTIDAGIVTVTAYLQALQMHRPPTCHGP